jgi:hypothetical protein
MNSTFFGFVLGFFVGVTTCAAAVPYLLNFTPIIDECQKPLPRDKACTILAVPRDSLKQTP